MWIIIIILTKCYKYIEIVKSKSKCNMKEILHFKCFYNNFKF